MFPGIKLIIASINRLPSKYEVMLEYLSSDELNHLKSYCFHKDKLRFSLSRYILKSELSKYLGIMPKYINFAYNEFGKPYVRRVQSVQFNISHSHNLVAVAFGKNNVGIDIEYHKKLEGDLISDLFFTNNEIDYLLALPPQKKEKGFYQIWTFKEAYIKAIGLGMSGKPASIDVLETQAFRYKNEVYKIEAISNVGTTYSCALCYNTKMENIIEVINFDIIV